MSNNSLTAPDAVPRPPKRSRRNNRVYTLPIVEETSAGGVIVKVEDGQAYVAVISRITRNGHIEWCLPKGHLEYEETAEQAAIREIQEETGILGHIVTPLSMVDYWFSAEGKRIHKVVHHYLLEADSGRIGVENDPDHEAESAEWVKLNTVTFRLAYSNEKQIIQLAQDLLRTGN